MLQNKKIVMLLSIVLALIMWIYVIEDVNPVVTNTIENVKVRILNEEALTQRGLALVGDGDYEIDIKVEGKRSDLVKLEESEIVATADVFGYSIGQNSIPVSIKVPDNIDIISQNNYKLQIEIEELISLYKDIDINFIGEIKEGQEPIVYENSPWEVEVKGAKSKVSKVVSVVGNVDVNLLNEYRKIIPTELVVLDKDNQPISDLKLSSNIVEIDAGIGYKKEVPLELEIVGETEPTLEIVQMKYPENIIIKGTKEEIDEIESVKADIIDISNIKTTTDVPIKLHFPKGTTVSQSKNQEEPKLSVIVKGIIIKEFQIDNIDIEYINLNEGLSVVINTPSVDITLSGLEDVLNNINIEDLKVYLDLKDLSSGIHTVPIQIQDLGNVKEVKIEPEHVHITINESI